MKLGRRYWKWSTWSVAMLTGTLVIVSVFLDPGQDGAFFLIEWAQLLLIGVVCFWILCWAVWFLRRAAVLAHQRHFS